MLRELSGPSEKTRARVAAARSMLPRQGGPPVEWLVADRPIPYPDAVRMMDTRVAAIKDGQAAELVWLLEHPPLYTAGTSAQTADLVTPDRFPVFQSGRGGQYTYHGPGQRVAYVMLDLSRRRQDLRAYVSGLEEWLIRTLAHLGVAGERRDDRIGIWIRRPELAADREDKIAAIGIRIRRWITFHGVSLNIDPNLEHFSGIVPCGVAEHGVTSLADLDRQAEMANVDLALRREFETLFGETVPASPDFSHPRGASSCRGGGDPEGEARKA